MENCIFCYNPINQDTDVFHKECCKKFFGKEELPDIPFKLNDIHKLAAQNINKHLTVTGVQKKLSVGIEKTSHKDRLTIVGWNDITASYILKTQSKKFPELPEVEDLTMHLAHLAGIKTVPHVLVRFKAGELTYLTKRIDRNKKGKIHMEDMCQLTERLTEDKYKGSMEQVGKIIVKFSSTPGLDSVIFFELIVFCFLTGNSDMHLKNFSLIHNQDGSIRLCPAYDLVATTLVNPSDKEETALTLNGKKNKIKREDFLIFGTTIGLNEKQIFNAIKTITQKLSKSSDLIDRSFLSKEMKEKYKELIISRTARLSV
ncbi:MAG: HipA domain-containing protein [Candidatus Caenarcaniphilales bacterium]|nr:HipA domain-containing protein [Candidatus Caenarcaniphilales bacterium]